MSLPDDFSFSAEEFSGTVRLFPLPNLVLFPRVMQPLHIFEPRYCELLEEAVAGDRLIAMALLRPGWEDDYEGTPLIYPVVCLGRVAVHQKTEAGSYNLLLSGVNRVQIVRELPKRKRFREAVARICPDRHAPERAAEGPALQRRLRSALLDMSDCLPQAQEQLEYLLGADVQLGTLTDVLSYMLDLSLAEKQSLLAEFDVYRRAERLLEHLEVMAGDVQPGSSGEAEFPPQFSAN